MVSGNQLQNMMALQENTHTMEAAIAPAILWCVHLAYGAIFMSVSNKTASVWTLTCTVVNVQTFLVFCMDVWFCGLAALLLYEYIKTSGFIH